MNWKSINRAMSCVHVYDSNCHMCLASSTACLEAMLCFQASCAAKTSGNKTRQHMCRALHELQCPWVMAIPMSPLLGNYLYYTGHTLYMSLHSRGAGAGPRPPDHAMLTMQTLNKIRIVQ